MKQKKEWGEILSGFEARNKYVVLDENGREVLAAFEEGGAMLARWLLKSLRAFVMRIDRNVRVGVPAGVGDFVLSPEDANKQPIKEQGRE